MLVGRVEGGARLALLYLRAPVLKGREKFVAVDCEDEGRAAEEAWHPAVDGRDDGTRRAIVKLSSNGIDIRGCCSVVKSDAVDSSSCS